MSHVPAQRLEDRLNFILDSIPDERNRTTLHRFLREKRALRKQAGGTILNDATALHDLAACLKGRPFEQATPDDILAYAETSTRERIWRSRRKDGKESVRRRTVQLKESTLCTRNARIVQFYKWLFKTRQSPDVVLGLRTTRPEHDHSPADAFLSPEDIRCLLQAYPDMMDQAFFATLID